jgi:hypothetical protein
MYSAYKQRWDDGKGISEGCEKYLERLWGLK